MRRRSTFGQLRVGKPQIRLAIHGSRSNGWFQSLAIVVTRLALGRIVSSEYRESCPNRGEGLQRKGVVSCQPHPNCVEK
jgi:hypothetical protein